MIDDLISYAVDEVHIETLKFVVKSLEKYPVNIVLSSLKEEIKKLEKK